jgi:hypothetical protein
MTATELHSRYEFNVGWSHEQILDVILNFMTDDELENFLSVLDSVAEQAIEY